LSCWRGQIVRRPLFDKGEPRRIASANLLIVRADLAHRRGTRHGADFEDGNDHASFVFAAGRRRIAARAPDDQSHSFGQSAILPAIEIHRVLVNVLDRECSAIVEASDARIDLSDLSGGGSPIGILPGRSGNPVRGILSLQCSGRRQDHKQKY
jgi:hypothetical protein